MDRKLVSQALDELMTTAGNKQSRDATARAISPEAFAIAKEAYEFVVSYPVDWNARLLNNQVLEELRRDFKDKYLFLEDSTIWRASNYFAYLWK